MKRYVNAKEVLPSELLSEVQKYHSGIMWIPPKDYERRNEAILKLRKQGLTYEEIAEEIGLSVERIKQIFRMKKV